MICSGRDEIHFSEIHTFSRVSTRRANIERGMYRSGGRVAVSAYRNFFQTRLPPRFFAFSFLSPKVIIGVTHRRINSARVAANPRNRRDGARNLICRFRAMPYNRRARIPRIKRNETLMFPLAELKLHAPRFHKVLEVEENYAEREVSRFRYIMTIR